MVLPCLPTISHLVTASLPALKASLSSVGLAMVKAMTDVDEKLKILERQLLRVEAFISEAEECQISDQALQVLVRDAEQLAYDAADFLDAIAIKVSYLDGGNQGYKEDVFRMLLSLLKRSSSSQLNTIKDRLDYIQLEVDRFPSAELVDGRHKSAIQSKLPTSSLLDDVHSVVGRDSDVDSLIQMIRVHYRETNSNSISVIPIVGMVGVGKTALARRVFCSEEVRIFRVTMWISVNRDSDVTTLTRSIISALTSRKCEDLGFDILQKHLQEELYGRTFLLVLDDFWNEKQSAWDLLLDPLRSGSRESVILVTTRSQVVSSMVCTSRMYELGCLSDLDCWSLLQPGNVNFHKNPELEAFGMRIAIKCKGLPLAAKTLRNVLHSNADEDVWEGIARSNLWDQPEVKNEISTSFRWSYLHLTPQLRQCFAYCSLFSQNHKFNKEKIVQMWIAEGFVQPEGRRRLEELGISCFDQLLSLSFFLEKDGKYTMHDAVHSFAQSVSGEKFFRMEEDDELQISCIHKNTRHSSLLVENVERKTFESFYMCKGLRTFLLINGSRMTIVPSAFFKKMKHIRVLDLSNSGIRVLSRTISNMKHLRFLDLSRTPLKQLPGTTYKLYCLQTLRLQNCVSLISLPRRIGRLSNLRHLDLGRNHELASMTSGIGRLTGLQTLNEFIVHQRKGKISELKNLNSIRGSLCIKKLENVKHPEEALEARLARKKHLQRLELHWTSVTSESNDEHVLENLLTTPHDSLRELFLKGYGGSHLSNVGNPLFSKLASISFDNFRNCIRLPMLGQLPKLKSLLIKEVNMLTLIDETFLGDVPGFPFLETLEFCNMLKLEHWAGLRADDLPCLRELTIINCPELVTLPSFEYLRSLQKLELEKCHKLHSLPGERLSDAVQSLIITECPILEEKYRRDGEHWMTIMHIPHIQIGDDYHHQGSLRERLLKGPLISLVETLASSSQ